MNRPHTYKVAEAAQQLGIGPRILMRWLRNNRVIDACNLPFNAPRQKGYMTIHRSSYIHPVRGEVETAQPRVTAHGITWLRGRLTEAELITKPTNPPQETP